MSDQAQSVSDATETPVWLRPEVFFVRRIALDPVTESDQQVELALEATAPFALEQLYYGYMTADNGLTALVFTTHRRIFPGEGWPEAAVVLPTFVALLGEPPATARVRLWQNKGSLVAAGWDGKGLLPGVLLAKQAEPGDEAATRIVLLEEIQRRLGGLKPELEEFSGPVTTEPARGGQGLNLNLSGSSVGQTLVTKIGPERLEAMDVRDKGALLARRQSKRRESLLWHAFAVAVTGIAVAVMLECLLFAGGFSLRHWRAQQALAATDVHKIETAQTLSTRIEEMTQHRLRPFEMLALLNDSRPASIQFLRCTTSGLATLEVEGQTGSADSVGVYETALKGLTELESVEIHDVRLREGTTTFQLTAIFKPGVLVEGEDGS